MHAFILSALSDFAEIVARYLSEIWQFIVFIGQVASVLVILVGAILWLTQISVNRGKVMVLSGIVLAIVVQYFVLHPPALLAGAIP